VPQSLCQLGCSVLSDTIVCITKKTHYDDWRVPCGRHNVPTRSNSVREVLCFNASANLIAPLSLSASSESLPGPNEGEISPQCWCGCGIVPSMCNVVMSCSSKRISALSNAEWPNPEELGCG